MGLNGRKKTGIKAGFFVSEKLMHVFPHFISLGNMHINQ
ncbi:hypothetical protein SAMN05216178_4738 [Pseudomonas saponiphila]|uniref:Uncharacterized protein n=1 Tax=Pseudomonas saponiphila TaxID=556534 RepID=A0A1H4V4P3_9PSED|nr:hypothetical protein SAMN05216178_4738 [Pseudomonas saponiphila]